MKPESIMPQINLEQMPANGSSNIEHLPNLPTPEIDNKNQAERYEQKSEMSAILSDVSLTTILPTPVVVDDKAVKDTTLGDMSVKASDNDLIEKEWVEKAKKIVHETRNNPYQREEEVNKLQVDYLKKRYGRELGVAE